MSWKKKVPGKNATVIRKKMKHCIHIVGYGEKNKTGYVFMRVMSEAE